MGRTPKLTSHAFSSLWLCVLGSSGSSRCKLGIKRVKPQTPVLMKQLEDARPDPSVSQIGLLLFSLCSIPHRQYIFTHKPHQDFMDDPACEVPEIVCFYYLRKDAIISKTILPFSSTQNCQSMNVYRSHELRAWGCTFLKFSCVYP